jgi:hypothetical protein
LRRYTRFAALALGIAFALPGVSSANDINSLSAAAAAGDPAATAPSIPLPSSFAYKGGTITPEAAQRAALICNQDARGVTCFDSAKAAASAVGGMAYDSPPASAARKKGPTAHAASQCSEISQLHLFQYAQSTACYYTGNGWDLPLTGRGAWYDMGSYENQASAYFMGDHSGHMSDYFGGGGYWVPYPTDVGDSDLSLNGTSWSNRISSRYRN